MTFSLCVRQLPTYFRPTDVGSSMKLDCAIDFIQLRRPNFHLWHTRSLGDRGIISHSASIDSELDRRTLRLAAFEAITKHAEVSRCEKDQDDGNDDGDDDRSRIAAQLQPKI